MDERGAGASPRLLRPVLRLKALLGRPGETLVALRFALLAYGVRVVSAFIAFVSQVILARWMGSAEYGVFVFVLVVSVILGGLACLGFQTSVIRFVPDYLGSARLSLARGILLTSRLFALASASLLAGLALLALWLFRGSVPDYYLLPLVLGTACLPMMALSEIMDGTARAFSFARLALLPTFIVRPLLILVYMALAVEGLGLSPNAVTATGALVAAVWTATLSQLLLVHRNASRVVGPVPREIVFRSWLTVALPIFLTEGFFNLLTNVDILMVGHFLPPEDVAIYYASVKTLALVHFVYFAVKAGAAPRIASMHAGGERRQYERFVAQTIRWTFWPSLAASAMVLIGGEILLGLFGPDFDAGYPLLFVLILGVIARASVGPAESILTMSGQQRACAAVYFATILLNLGANMALIPLYGLYGAAFATAGAMIFEAFMLYAVARRRLGLNLFVFVRMQPEETGR